MDCPSCHGEAVQRCFEGLNGAQVELDVCEGCHALWFDTAESRRLAPQGVLSLFRALHQPEGPARQPLGSPLACPRCGQGLALTHDLARGNRFHYHRCPQGHGHLISFFQFLREKGIVRTLSARELQHLRQRVQHVQCSHCGQSVPLDTASACAHCQTPVSVLDEGGVEALLRRPSVKGSHVAAAAAAMPLAAGAMPPSQHNSSTLETVADTLDVAEVAVEGWDLVGAGLEALFEGLGSLLD